MRHRWPATAAWPRLAVPALLTVVGPFVLFNWAGLVIPSGYSAVLNATAPLFYAYWAPPPSAKNASVRAVAGLRPGLCGCGTAGAAGARRRGPARGAGAGLHGSRRQLRPGRYPHETRHHGAPATAGPASPVHVAAALVLLPPLGVSAPAMRPTAGAWLAVAMLGCVTSGLHVLDQHAADARDLGQRGHLVSLHDPAVWRDLGRLFLGEPVTAGMLPGCALILATTALITGSTRSGRHRPRPDRGTTQHRQ